jgi:hypothetical protein
MINCRGGENSECGVKVDHFHGDSLKDVKIIKGMKLKDTAYTSANVEECKGCAYCMASNSGNVTSCNQPTGEKCVCWTCKKIGCGNCPTHFTETDVSPTGEKPLNIDFVNAMGKKIELKNAREKCGCVKDAAYILGLPYSGKCENHRKSPTVNKCVCGKEDACFKCGVYEDSIAPPKMGEKCENPIHAHLAGEVPCESASPTTPAEWVNGSLTFDDVRRIMETCNVKDVELKKDCLTVSFVPKDVTGIHWEDLQEKMRRTINE